MKLSKERHFSAGKDMRNEINGLNSEATKSTRHSMPGICQSSDCRDWLCHENEANSDATSSGASSELSNEDVVERSELQVPVSERSSRSATRPNRPHTIDSYLTADGGFKRRSRRDVCTIKTDYVVFIS